MQLSLGALLCSMLLFATSLASAHIKRDADFASVRTRLDRPYIDEEWHKQKKYFHESTFHQHYDGRFADQPLKYDEKQVYLTTLVQTYLATMNEIGAETWLMHGTLLGWYWNRKIMPWDSDIDVMVSQSSIHLLATYYNMTVHHFKTRGSKKGSDYLLEVNPFYSEDIMDPDNHIDARWIDMDTGLFIDITTLRYNSLAEGEEDMFVKDMHSYVYDDIYPLRESTFENTPVWVPYAYGDILIEEYGDQALTDLYHDNHKFDVAKQEWVPQKMAVLSSSFDDDDTRKQDT